MNPYCTQCCQSKITHYVPKLDFLRFDPPSVALYYLACYIVCPTITDGSFSIEPKHLVYDDCVVFMSDFILLAVSATGMYKIH